MNTDAEGQGTNFTSLHQLKEKAKSLMARSWKVESKLAMALVGTRSAMEKNLDALARELKLKTNGKQMLAALEKAGLI